MSDFNESAASLRSALHAYALRLACGNENIAGNLLAVTLSRITQRATACPATIMSFTVWAKMVMKNTFYETVADAQKRELYHLFYHGTLGLVTSAGDDGDNLRWQIYIMSHLTPQQATAMTLLLNGYSLDVIAGEMGITVEGVKCHLAKARLAITRMWGS